MTTADQERIGRLGKPPAGNEWRFVESNLPVILKPSHGAKEVKNLNEVQQQLLAELTASYLQEDWQFASLLEESNYADSDEAGLVFIFTHPLRDTLVPKGPIDPFDFVTENFFTDADEKENPGVDLNDPINRVLTGTNWLIYDIQAGHNIIGIDHFNSRVKQFFKASPIERRWYDQTGVAYINLGLITLDRRIKIVEEEIEPLQRERDKLAALKTDDPAILFPWEYVMIEDDSTPQNLS